MRSRWICCFRFGPGRTGPPPRRSMRSGSRTGPPSAQSPFRPPMTTVSPSSTSTWIPPSWVRKSVDGPTRPNLCRGPPRATRQRQGRDLFPSVTCGRHPEPEFRLLIRTVACGGEALLLGHGHHQPPPRHRRHPRRIGVDDPDRGALTHQDPASTVCSRTDNPAVRPRRPREVHRLQGLDEGDELCGGPAAPARSAARGRGGHPVLASPVPRMDEPPSETTSVPTIHCLPGRLMVPFGVEICAPGVTLVQLVPLGIPSGRR